MRSLKEQPRGFWTSLVAIAGGFTVLGGAAIMWEDIRPWPSKQACDALLWTIQRDIAAAEHHYTRALELRQKLTDPDAIAFNNDVLRSQKQSIQVFTDKKTREMKECNR
jgi:hypothetical protein